MDIGDFARAWFDPERIGAVLLIAFLVWLLVVNAEYKGDGK